MNPSRSQVSIAGSPVPIQKGAGAVFLAEEVETALSVKEARVRGDIYTTLSVSNLKRMGEFLKDTSRLPVICADSDAENTLARKTVEEAMTFLKEQGFAVSVIRLDLSKGDFNDIVRQEGVQAVQAYFKDYLKDERTLSSNTSPLKAQTSNPSRSPSLGRRI